MTQARPEEPSGKERDNLLSKAYSKASRKLRESHSDEFNKYMEEATSELGVAWRRRVTPEEKAEQEFRTLLEAHPWLREKVSTESGPTG